MFSTFFKLSRSSLGPGVHVQSKHTLAAGCFLLTTHQLARESSDLCLKNSCRELICIQGTVASYMILKKSPMACPDFQDFGQCSCNSQSQAGVAKPETDQKSARQCFKYSVFQI